jgi:hypothetical protein
VDQVKVFFFFFFVLLIKWIKANQVSKLKLAYLDPKDYERFNSGFISTNNSGLHICHHPRTAKPISLKLSSPRSRSGYPRENGHNTQQWVQDARCGSWCLACRRQRNEGPHHQRNQDRLSPFRLCRYSFFFIKNLFFWIFYVVGRRLVVLLLED